MVVACGAVQQVPAPMGVQPCGAGRFAYSDTGASFAAICCATLRTVCGRARRHRGIAGPEARAATRRLGLLIAAAEADHWRGRLQQRQPGLLRMLLSPSPRPGEFRPAPASQCPRLGILGARTGERSAACGMKVSGGIGSCCSAPVTSWSGQGRLLGDRAHRDITGVPARDSDGSGGLDGVSCGSEPTVHSAGRASARARLPPRRPATARRSRLGEPSPRLRGTSGAEAELAGHVLRGRCGVLRQRR